MFGGLFEVHLDDGTSYRVPWDARDIRAWEAWTGQNWFEQKMFSATTQAYVAFSASRRAGRATTWEEFDSHVVATKALNGAVPKDRKTKTKTRRDTPKVPTGG